MSALPSDTPAGAEPRDRALRWPAAVVALLGLNVCVCTVTVIAATRIAAPAGAEPDYYEKALNWDETARERAASEALGWTASLAAAPTPDGARRLTLVLRDRDGLPVEAASVEAEVFHPRLGARRTLRLEPLSGGLYAGAAPLEAAGLWEVRLRAERGADVWLHDESLELNGSAAR